jgi:hypothetical protein
MAAVISFNRDTRNQFRMSEQDLEHAAREYTFKRIQVTELETLYEYTDMCGTTHTVTVGRYDYTAMDTIRHGQQYRKSVLESA